MVLSNVHILNGCVGNIVVTGSSITAVQEGNNYKAAVNDIVTCFEDCLAFPGLINSHDHLEFNLFPQLGNGIYSSYMYWGSDIHASNKQAIQNVLKVPEVIRVQWGAYKNLLCGITTVVQHGKKQYTNDVPVTIFNQCHSLHSVQLEKRWRYKLNRPFAGCRPFVIHTGEGTDRKSFEEINELLRWNLFSRRLVGVHGVAMDAIQAAGFDALVWCPVSNYFLLGATAQMKQLKKVTDILFGTDSALSAQWNAWHHLRDARKTRMLTDAELLAAITNKAAAVWGIRTAGTVRQGYDADIVVAEKNGVEGYDAFFAINPGNIQLVLHKGNIALFDAALLPQIAPSTGINHYSRIYINGRCKYVWGDLPALIKKIKTVAPDVQLPVGIE